MTNKKLLPTRLKLFRHMAALLLAALVGQPTVAGRSMPFRMPASLFSRIMRTPRLLVACLAACLNLTAHADYQINFLTFNGGTSNPAYDTDGVTKLGPSFSGQLYVGSSPGALVAIGVPMQFSTVNGALNAAANGFIVANNLTVASASLFGGSAAFYQLRAWTGAATYELAIATPGAKYGASTIQTVTLGGTPAGGGVIRVSPDATVSSEGVSK